MNVMMMLSPKAELNLRSVSSSANKGKFDGGGVDDDDDDDDDDNDVSPVLFQWERRSHTFSSQTLFNSVFYMDFTWICNTNYMIMCSRTPTALLNLFPRKKHWVSRHVISDFVL